MSSCRSFGSSVHRYSQSQKMSIGVVVEPLAKPKAGPTKKVNMAVQPGEKSSFNKNSTGDNNDGLGTTSILENVSRTERQVDCQWGSLNKGSPFSPRRKQTKRGNQIAERNDIRKQIGREANMELANETSFIVVQEPLAPDEGLQQGTPHRPHNGTKETLRMKLWEVLSTVPSPNKLLPETQHHKGDDIEQVNACDNSVLIKSGQKSDTIETDSENPAQAITRPVTRSLTKEKRPTRVSSKQPKNKPYSCGKNYPGKHVFSFEDKWFINQPRGGSDGDLMAKRKRSDREQSGTKLRDVSFMVKGTASKTAIKNQESSAAQKVTSRGKEVSLGLQKPEGNHLKPETLLNNKAIHHCLEAEEEERRGHSETPSSHEKADKQEPIDNQPLKDVAAPHTDFNSPPSKLKRTAEISSPSSFSLVHEVEPQIQMPAHKERDFVFEETYEFRSRLIRNAGYSSRNLPGALSEIAIESEDFLHSSPEPSAGEKDAENELSTPEERQSYSIAEDLSVSEEYIDTSPLLGCKVKPMIHQTEQCRNQGVDIDELSLIMLSPEAHINTDDVFEEALKKNEQDGTARAVAVFGLALQRVKNKMISATNKKCLDILASSAEETHSRMQNIESQIQMDIERLTSIGKTKRKRLESRLQEQQAQLRYLQENFLEEANRHLQLCKSTMQELEAERIKLKGTVEKQKASYQKFLLQAEETVETQLSNAQQRITFVQQQGRQKMLQLRIAIAECLKDGFFT